MTSNRITVFNKKDVWSKEGEIEMRKKEFEKKKSDREKLKAQNDKKNKQNEQMEIKRGAIGHALVSSDSLQVDLQQEHEPLVISFDCEFIEVREAHRYVHLATEVSIMALQNGIISNVYQEKIHHQDYRVTNYVHNLTGFDDKMFKNKNFKSLQTVREDVAYWCRKADLIVGSGIRNDFDALGFVFLDEFDYKILELQKYFYDYNQETGQQQGIGLRSLYYHFFNEDIQGDNDYHGCDVDAKAGLKVYFELKKLLNEGFDPEYYHVKRMPKIDYFKRGCLCKSGCWYRQRQNELKSKN